MDPIWRAGAGRTVCPSETPVCELLGDCYKETIFGMPIMTKLQQLPHYSIFLLTQLSSTLTHDLY